MSVWTHVCGCIRVDYARLSPKRTEVQKEKIKNILENTLPCDGEGSLEYEIIENKNKYSIAAFVIPIWGDLKDYDNEMEVREWFEFVLRNLCVRSAVITIETVYKKSTYSYTYKDVENLKKQ